MEAKGSTEEHTSDVTTYNDPDFTGSTEEHTSDVTTYNDPDFTHSMMTKVQDKQLQCDTIVEVENEHFHVHRCVLAKSCLYFEAMFAEDWVENQKGVVRLQGTKKCAFKEVVHFAYTGSVRLSDDNVVDVLSAAQQYCYPIITKLCLQHMNKTLNKENCLHYMKVAELYDYPGLLENTTKMAMNNFSFVSKTALFMDLSKEALFQFLTSEELRTDSELDVFQAVQLWLESQPERLELTHELMSHIQFNLLCYEDIKTQVLTWDIMRQNKLFLDQLLDYLVDSGNLKLPQSSICRSPKLLHKHPDQFYVLEKAQGNWQFFSMTFRKDSEMAVEMLNPPEGCYLNEVGVMFNSGHGPMLLTRKGNYMCLCHYDEFANRWQQLSTAPDIRGSTSTTPVLLKDYLICIGGYGPARPLSSVQQYRFTRDSWQSFPAFLHCVYWAAACIYKNNIYISGGRSDSRGNDSSLFSHMFSYLPARYVWVKLDPMPYQCCRHAMVTSGSNIYVIGGEDAKWKPINKPLLYNPEINQWTSLTLDGLGRELTWYTRTATVHDDAIYVIGHCEHSGEISLFHLRHEKNMLSASCVAQLNIVANLLDLESVKFCWKYVI